MTLGEFLEKYDCDIEEAYLVIKFWAELKLRSLYIHRGRSRKFKKVNPLGPEKVKE